MAGGLEQGDLQDAFQPKPFYDSMVLVYEGPALSQSPLTN